VRHALDVASGFTEAGVIAAFQKETGVALIQGGKVVATPAQIRQFGAWHHRRVYTRMLQDADQGHAIMGKIVGKGDVDSIYELYQLESFGRSPKDWLLQQRFPNLYHSTP